MRARLGVHEIISTIMLNRIVEVLLPFLLVTVLGAASLRTASVVPGAALLKLDRVFPALRGSAASVAFPSRWRWPSAPTPSSTARDAAGRCAGSASTPPPAAPRDRRTATPRAGDAPLGAIAGGAMAATVLGYKGYYELGLGAGAGFTGIAVALLGRGHPVGIVLAAVLFGTLQQAGLAINARIPKEAMDVLAAAVILLVAVANRAAAAPPGKVAEPEPAPVQPEVVS